MCKGYYLKLIKREETIIEVKSGGKLHQVVELRTGRTGKEGEESSVNFT